ncbi:Antilisterial bacteriocin subtilosin biosynthesis protein AlbA [Planctomycetes bacterium Pan216]|uniref:Antilisterial bacteriocin subtilosin biosynthesis protein AlbA n=1 Tax=Kolteria novifilia TaxID=2527975 RepID=A0A518B253_9BACT|nr:Antilisterial bacteriocin subtilosin biosynthesis protein AlbA [Planctomycetes bacterium Pan216]
MLFIGSRLTGQRAAKDRPERTPWLGIPLLARLGYRMATQIPIGVAAKAAYLCALKGMRAVWLYKRALKKGELFPPFMFVALTDTCNLRCEGCWVEKEGTAHYMPTADLLRMIENGKRRGANYYTLLGGEPFMHKGIWEAFRKHRDCYFQVITNGMFFNEKNVKELRRLGNVTPLISIDGMEANNDQRRGKGVFESATSKMKLLRDAGILFGIATTTTGKNMTEVMTDEYLEYWIRQGAMYIWYYVYRPVGEHPHPEYCMSRDQLIEMRKRLLHLRRRQPIFIIDTYWTADGEAFCPAAMGLGFHVGPSGSIEPCPPLSFARERIQDNDGDFYKTIADSEFLKGFQGFVKERTKGCVILEHPQELVEYIGGMGAQDFSGRDALAEINAGSPRSSHHLPGEEIPEDFWLYRFLKRQVFFGMGALG